MSDASDKRDYETIDRLKEKDFAKMDQRAKRLERLEAGTSPEAYRRKHAGESLHPEIKKKLDAADARYGKKPGVEKKAVAARDSSPKVKNDLKSAKQRGEKSKDVSKATKAVRAGEREPTRVERKEGLQPEAQGERSEMPQQSSEGDRRPSKRR